MTSHNSKQPKTIGHASQWAETIRVYRDMGKTSASEPSAAAHTAAKIRGFDTGRHSFNGIEYSILLLAASYMHCMWL